MIHIEKDQIVPENEDLRVFAVSGDYDDNDLIECYRADNPGFAMFAFSADFIKYGGIVYRSGDPLSLGEVLIKIDPNSTHDSVTLFKEEEARRIKREKDDFTPENPVPVDESISQVAQDEAKVAEEQVVSTPEATPTPSDTPTSTTTPAPSPSTAPTLTPSPSETPTPVPSGTPVPNETPTPTVTATPTPSETPTPTSSPTPSPTSSETPTPTPSETPAPAPSETPIPSETPAPTPSPSATPESTLAE